MAVALSYYCSAVLNNKRVRDSKNRRSMGGSGERVGSGNGRSPYGGTHYSKSYLSTVKYGDNLLGGAQSEKFLQIFETMLDKSEKLC